MSKSLQIIAVSLSFAACSSLAAQEMADTSQSLSWLSGCWEHLDGSTRESWSRSHDGLLFGHAVTIRDGRLAAFEDIRIEPRGESSAYIVYVNGANGVTFIETERGNTNIAFENPTHDFPQRIAYERDGENLTATISLMDGGNAIEIPMKECTID